MHCVFTSRSYTSSRELIVTNQQQSANISELQLLWYVLSIGEISWWKNSPCSLFNAPHFSGKISWWKSGKRIFKDILKPNFWEENNRFSTSSLELSALLFSTKLVAKSHQPFQAFFSLCLRIWIAYLWRACGPMKTTLFDFCVTDSWEFLSEVTICWPCSIHGLKCRGGSKMLLESTSGRCCTFFLPGSSDCWDGQSLFVYGKSLLDCPFDTMNCKTSCSPAAVLEV